MGDGSPGSAHLLAHEGMPDERAEVPGGSGQEHPLPFVRRQMFSVQFRNNHLVERRRS